jgi:hypothetical protein
MEKSSSGRRIRSTRTLLFSSFVVSFFFLLVSWSVASPVGSSPDEGFHLNSIWCANGNWSGCIDEVNNDGMALVPQELVSKTCFVWQSALSPLLSPACQNDSIGNTDLVPSFLNERQYPGHYYRILNIFASSDIHQSVIQMRIFTSLVSAIILALTFFVISSHLQLGLLKAWLCLLFPLTIFLLPSVNPSSWAILGVGTYWAALAEAISSSPKYRRRWSISLTLLTATIAFVSRYDAQVYIFFITILVLIWRLPLGGLVGAFRRKKVLQVALVATCFVSVSIILKRLVEQNFTVTAPTQNNLGLYVTNLVDFPTFLAGAFGGWGRPSWPLGLGWFDTPVPQIVTIVGISSCGYFVLANQSQLTTKTKSIALLLFLFLIAVNLQTLQVRQSVGDFFLQPRYFLPLLIVVIGILTTSDTNHGKEKLPTGLLATGLSISGVVSLHSNLGRWTLNRDAVNDFLPLDLSNESSWWWNSQFSPMHLFLLGTTCTVIFVYSTVQLIRHVSNERSNSEILP